MFFCLEKEISYSSKWKNWLLLRMLSMVELALSSSSCLSVFSSKPSFPTRILSLMCIIEGLFSPNSETFSEILQKEVTGNFSSFSAFHSWDFTCCWIMIDFFCSVKLTLLLVKMQSSSVDLSVYGLGTFSWIWWTWCEKWKVTGRWEILLF